MHILKTSIHGNPNVGLYGIATDEYCLLGKEAPEKLTEEIEKVLKVPVHRITIAGTSLIGVFAAANSNILLIPDIIFDEEKEALDKLKIKYAIIPAKLTALGNNILINDNACIINNEFTGEAAKAIQKATGLEPVKMTIADAETVGSCAVLNSKGCVIHREISEEQITMVKEMIKVPCSIGSVNMGNPFIKSGTIANSNGFVVGQMSSGPEIQNLDESLGFLEY